MNLINQNSLAKTLDNFNNTLYSGKTLPAGDRKKLAFWLASRQGLERSYAGMVTPTAYDYKNGVTLFTGEKIDMIVSIGHIMGEEGLRALYLLDVKDKTVQYAINKSRSGINKAVKEYYKRGFGSKGWYCCGKCSAAYWRNLSAEGVNKNKDILNAGIKILNKLRDGKGKWHRFPFYYTIFTLTGINLPAAIEELRYARIPTERLASRKAISKFDMRRKMIAERALEMM